MQSTFVVVLLVALFKIIMLKKLKIGIIAEYKKKHKITLHCIMFASTVALSDSTRTWAYGPVNCTDITHLTQIMRYK